MTKRWNKKTHGDFVQFRHPNIVKQNSLKFMRVNQPKTISYQDSKREPWNKKPPIIISKDAAPIISFPTKNPTIGTVNTA